MELKLKCYQCGGPAEVLELGTSYCIKCLNAKNNNFLKSLIGED